MEFGEDGLMVFSLWCLLRMNIDDAYVKNSDGCLKIVSDVNGGWSYVMKSMKLCDGEYGEM